MAGARRGAAMAVGRWLLGAALLGCGDDADVATRGSTDAATDDRGEPPAAPEPDGEDPHAWSHLGYDERSQYFNPFERTLSVDSAADLELAWTFEVAGFPPGMPVIAEGMVFVLASGGVFAIDLDSGEEVWSRPEIIGTSSVAYADGFIYVHASPGAYEEQAQAASLYKLRASDGEVSWGPVVTYDAPWSDGTSSPVVADGKVLVGRSTYSEIMPEGREEAVGAVAAHDVETGEQVWEYVTVEPPENGAMVWSTVSVDVDAGVVYAATGNNYTVLGGGSDAIHAIDLGTGERLWLQQVRDDDLWSIGGDDDRDTDFGANPIVAEIDGERIIAAGDKGSAFWALDADGEVLWSREQLGARRTTSTGGILNNGAFDGNFFYAVVNEPDEGPYTWVGRSLLHAFDPRRDGDDVWDPIVLDQVTWGMPTVANGLLFVPVDTVLDVYDAWTGRLLARFETGGTIAAGGAAVVDGKVVVASGLQYPFGQVHNNNQVHCYALP